MARKQTYQQQPPGIIVYTDMLPALQAVEPEQVGRLVIAAIHYLQYGAEPIFDDEKTEMIWLMYRPRLEANNANWQKQRDAGQDGGLYSAYKRQCGQDGTIPLEYDDWKQWKDRVTEIEAG